MRIARTWRFAAAHFLPLVPEGHKCRNVHGHNYRVEAVFEGSLDDRGFVRDFAELDEAARPSLAQLDHCLINDVITNPTAEMIALWFMARLGCARVRVYETDDCWAEVGS